MPKKKTDYGFCTVDMPWGECSEPATHLLECPPRRSIPMCDSHWEAAMDFEARLKADPEFFKKAEKLVNEAHAQQNDYD